MTTRPTTILALDPGLRALGFAVLTGTRLADGGVLHLRLLPKAQRAREARHAVEQWLYAFRPQVVVLERTYRHPVGPLNDLHRLNQAVGRLAAARHIPVTTYAPQTVRKSVVGDGWATKQKVAEILSARFPTTRMFLTQDKRWKERHWQNMFDAIALAVHHRSPR
jgi:Holliday junction resolvasome RuvABC endonuclease subunit